MSVNKVILDGRLTKYMEIRHLDGGTPVGNFTLAVQRNFKQDGEYKADFIRCSVFSKTAEFCSKYLEKGVQVTVVGRLQVRSWQDNDQQWHQVSEVVVEECYPVWSTVKNNATNNTSTQESFEPMDDDDDLPF